MTRAIVAPARIAADEVVVDAGCGVGGAAIEIARRYGAQVVGVTVSPVQVALARERAERAGIGERVRFLEGDCSTCLPFADHTVDVVVTIEAACHFADKPRFLAECARVLKPGGRVLIVDMLPHDREHYRQQMGHVWLGFSEENMRRLLETAGFEAIRAVSLPPDSSVKGPALFVSTAQKPH